MWYEPEIQDSGLMLTRSSKPVDVVLISPFDIPPGFNQTRRKATGRPTAKPRDKASP